MVEGLGAGQVVFHRQCLHDDGRREHAVRRGIEDRYLRPPRRQARSRQLAAYAGVATSSIGFSIAGQVPRALSTVARIPAAGARSTRRAHPVQGTQDHRAQPRGARVIRLQDGLLHDVRQVAFDVGERVRIDAKYHVPAAQASIIADVMPGFAMVTSWSRLSAAVP